MTVYYRKNRSLVGSEEKRNLDRDPGEKCPGTPNRREADRRIFQLKGDFYNSRAINGWVGGGGNSLKTLRIFYGKGGFRGCRREG